VQNLLRSKFKGYDEEVALAKKGYQISEASESSE
jgi:hypothetical protein